MDKFFLYMLGCFLLFWNFGTALKCRTGNQEDSEQYYRIMENCRRRYMMQDDGSSSSSSDESMSSSEDNFDRRIMSNGRYNSDYGRNGMGMFRNQNNNQRSRDWNNRSSSSDFFNRNMNGMNGRDRDNDNQRFRSNRRNMNNWRFYNGDNFDRQSDDWRNNYDSQQDQSCVTQCFFNELNLVDQRGFPDRTAVNEIMLEDIQDPELRDFVEEAIIQCFHYTNLEGKLSKCQYSQNLLTCLVEKGQERCEDWNNQYK